MDYIQDVLFYCSFVVYGWESLTLTYRLCGGHPMGLFLRGSTGTAQSRMALSYGVSQHCAVRDPTQEKWVDVPCSDMAIYYCEGDRLCLSSRLREGNRGFPKFF